MNKLGITYIHISSNPGIPERTYWAMRAALNNTFILCNGLTAETAEEKLMGNSVDLVAFGRGFLANPDFVRRIEQKEALNAVDFSILYTANSVGYIDYPVL